MSGYAAIISSDKAPPDRALLERMAAALAFRGPDATHITTQPGAGFVFTFLKTGPAPQSPQQPCSLDGRVWLIGDVRLDGRDDLRRKLEQHGASLPSNATDEELILHAYQKWGEQSFPDLIGDYAFALWDSTARRLLCLRDLIGSRPFFYAHKAGQLIFSNTLNVIRLGPQISAELDRHFIGDFLLEGWCPDLARSAFRDIARLPPGHLMSYSEGAVSVRRFTSFPIEEPLILKREEEYVERFRTLLDQAVADRLPQGPVSIFMSGGLDSTSVAAIAVVNAKKRRAPLDLRAYTIDCRELFQDPEPALASQAARSLEIPIELISGTLFRPCGGWGDPELQTPEPQSDPFLVSGRQLFRSVAARGRVVWRGYGGDDVLMGQAWPYLVYLFRRARVGSIAMSFGGYFLKHGRMPPLRGGFRARLQRWMGRTAPPPNYPRWIQPSFAEEQDLSQRWNVLQQTPRLFEHPLHPRGHRALGSGLWSSILESEEAGCTRVALEIRSPLLDQRVLHYSLQVPPVPWCAEKELLRRAVKGGLPEQIRLRSKTPLVTDPLAAWAECFKWNPFPLPSATPEIESFVNWGELAATLTGYSASNLWVDLRPVALNHWLRAISLA